MSPAWGNSWRLSSCAFLPASVRTRDQRHQNREQTVPAAPTSADELASGTRQRAFVFIGQAGLLWRRGAALGVENHWFLGTWAFQHRTQLGLGRRCFVLWALRHRPPCRGAGAASAPLSSAACARLPLDSGYIRRPRHPAQRTSCLLVLSCKSLGRGCCAAAAARPPCYSYSC